MDRPSIWLRTQIYPPDPVPKIDPRPQNFEIPNNGSPYTPPLPWPSQASGPAPVNPPAYPVYVTPPLPPLPQDIGLGYPQFSEE